LYFLLVSFLSKRVFLLAFLALEVIIFFKPTEYKKFW